ncbi:MAG: hypothetical protein QGF71_03040 [Rhodospirillales bacterium]|nr:hypothetical protein [Rhodospirillales bacterium]
MVRTIGYLILEADGAIVTAQNGDEIPVNVVAYVHKTGFGLLRMSKKTTVTPMHLGNSSRVGLQGTMLVASRGYHQPVLQPGL